jgi:uncharacterized protein involved in exopolysaccharide biosynthesis
MQFELGLKERLLGEYHSEVKALNEQIFSIQNELEKLRSGENDLKNEIIVKNKQNKILFIPLKDIPDIGQKYLDLYKEVQIQNKLYIFLIQQVEQLKIQELMSTSSIQVIDRAQPPLHKVKPKRLLVILSSILASSLLLTFIFILENNLKLMNYTDHDKYVKTIKVLHFWK